MANDIYNYSVMTNTGKGFVTNEDSRAFWRAGYTGNVWVATDVRESRDRVARTKSGVKNKDTALTMGTTAVDVGQAAVDNKNVDGESSAEKIRRIGPKPIDITSP